MRGGIYGASFAMFWRVVGGNGVSVMCKASPHINLHKTVIQTYRIHKYNGQMGLFHKYGKRFLIGLGIGLGVWLGMSLLGGAGLLAFISPNPLTNCIYASLFFGVIQASTAIMNDLFDGTKSSAKTTTEPVETKTSYIADAHSRTLSIPAHSVSYRDRLAAEQQQPESMVQR